MKFSVRKEQELSKKLLNSGLLLLKYFLIIVVGDISLQTQLQNRFINQMNGA